MKNLLLSLVLSTAGAVLLVSFPSASGYRPYYYGWNVTNSSIWSPSRAKSVYSPYPVNRYNYSFPVHRFPRSTFWGNSSHNSSHNFIWGRKSIYDRLLYFTRVKKASSFLRKVTVDMDFPARYQRPNGTITYIEVLDQKPVGEGGFASILRGGVGYKNVTLHFKSQRNKGFDFAVYIYGY